MKEKNVKIVCILDSSGSMHSVKQETIDGFNSFLETQKEMKDNATLSLIQFNSIYNVTYKNKSIKKAPLLNNLTYTPGSFTALNDAIGRTLVTLKAESGITDEIIVCILTDGLENFSKEFSRKDVQSLVKECEQEYGWVFIYLGANQDAFAESEKYGMDATNSFTYNQTTEGMDLVFNKVLGETVTTFRASSGKIKKYNLSGK